MADATGRVPFKTYSDHAQLPWQILRPLAASVGPKRGWIMGQNSAGNGVSIGSAAGLVSLGVSDRDEDLSTTAGLAKVLAFNQVVSGYATGTSADALTDTDFAAVAWGKDNQTIAKLSNSGGTNRSMAGVAFGLDPDNATPAVWVGPVAWCVARGVHAADRNFAGTVAYPVDAGATTDIGSTSVATAALMIPRPARHGVLTGVRIIPSAALSATSGNDRTITIWKIDTLGVAAAVSVATFTTTTPLLAQTAAAFTLTATVANLQMLETDILAYSTVHAASGAIIPQSAIIADMKVQ